MWVNLTFLIEAFADLQSFPGSELNETCQILDNLLDNFPLLSTIIIRPGKYFPHANIKHRTHKCLKQEQIKPIPYVSPLTDEGETGGRDALRGNENDLGDFALGSVMAQEDLEYLSDVQSDSEFSSSSNSQYFFQIFYIGLLSLPHHVSGCPVHRWSILPKSWLSWFWQLRIRPRVLLPPDFKWVDRTCILNFLKRLNTWQLTVVLAEPFINTEKAESRLKRPRGRPPKLSGEHSSTVYAGSKKSKHGEILLKNDFTEDFCTFSWPCSACTGSTSWHSPMGVHQRYLDQPWEEPRSHEVGGPPRRGLQVPQVWGCGPDVGPEEKEQHYDIWKTQPCYEVITWCVWLKMYDPHKQSLNNNHVTLKTWRKI